MLILQGRYNHAWCFTDRIDDVTRTDLTRICGHPLMEGRRIRVMPDAHSNGDGSVTGFTMTLAEPVILALEYGSGCGVSCAKLNETGIDLQKLDAVCHEIPAGRNLLFEPAFPFDFSRLCCYDRLKHYYEWPNSLGTLGGGNHFIELERDEEGSCYLTVHNGLGALSSPVLRFYSQKALKKAGKTREEACFEDSCLYGQDMADYLHDMHVMEEVCRMNRSYLTEFILGRMELSAAEFLDCCHHYTDETDGIIRHGAISAHEGERVIIPVNAREGCILGTGRGNPDWNYSAPHGGGRRLSRSAARKQLSMDQYRDAMKEVYSTTVCAENLDEAPQAYKSMDEILEATAGSVQAERILRPVYNYKG